MNYANTTKVEFIVDPKVLFHGWLICSYLQIFKWIKCKWLPGECADYFFDNIMTWSYYLHRRYSMSRQDKNGILINEHVLNREPVPFSLYVLKNSSVWETLYSQYLSSWIKFVVSVNVSPNYRLLLIVSSLFRNLIAVPFVFSRTWASHAEVYSKSRTYQTLLKITLKLNKTINKK